MKFGTHVGLLAALSAVISTPMAYAQAPAATELRVASLAPAGSKWITVLEKSAADIARDTQGRVVVKYYPGGEQGDEKDFVRKIKLGQLDGAAVTATGLGMIDESIRVLELPMMFDTVEEYDYVADKVWPYFAAKFEAKGFRLVDRGEVGWVHFLSKNKVETLANLTSQKVWIWADDNLVATTFKQVGISGVPLGVPEVDPALTSGRINACYNSPLGAVALQWYSKVKFMTEMPMSYAIGATVISIASLKKLSDADQKIAAKIQKNAGKKLRVAVRGENAAALKTMQRKGVTVVPTPPATQAEFRGHAEKVWKGLVGKMFSQAELDMVLKARDEYRAKHAAGAPK